MVNDPENIHQWPVNQLFATSDSKYLFTSDTHGTFKQWLIIQEKLLLYKDYGYVLHEKLTLMSESQDGKYLFTCDLIAELKIWDIYQSKLFQNCGHLIKTVKIHLIEWMYPSNDMKSFYVIINGNTLQKFCINGKDVKPNESISLKGTFKWGVITPDEKYFYCIGTWTDELMLYSIQKKKLVVNFGKVMRDCRWFYISDNKRYLILSSNCCIIVWDIKTSKVLKEIICESLRKVVLGFT